MPHNFRILVTGSGLVEEAQDYALSKGCVLETGHSSDTAEDLARRLKQFRPDGLIVRQGKINAAVIDAAPSLKVICKHGVGVENIDIDAAEIVARHAIEGAGFINDVAADGAGALYVSDSSGNVIHRFKDGKAEVWLDGPEVAQPNGMLVRDDKLIWGNNGDGRLKSAGLQDRAIATVASLGDGIIDGIAAGDNGDLLVSHWQGRVFRISAAGEVEKILDTTAPGSYIADFGYAPDRKLLVVPTFYGNSVAGYSLTD